MRCVPTKGPIGVGLVPLADELMYMYVTTPEPGNPRYPREGLAAAMRAQAGATRRRASPRSRRRITDDDEVVYKPLEWLFLEGHWHKGRVALLGDAVHATTPHLGQGAGMAIEDSDRAGRGTGAADTPQEAFRALQARRVSSAAATSSSSSKAICDSQLGRRPPVDQAQPCARCSRSSRSRSEFDEPRTE